MTGLHMSSKRLDAWAHDLPDNAFLLILQYLGWERASSVAVRQVCRDWRDVHDSGLTRLEPRFVPSDGPKGKALCGRARFPYVVALHLGKYYREATSLDAELQSAVGLWPRLTSLTVTTVDGKHVDISEGLNDQGLLALSKLVELETLELQNCDLITDEGMQELTSLRRIINVHISGSHRLTDKSAYLLATLKTLQEVNLCEVRLTNHGMRELSGLPALRTLSVILADLKEVERFQYFAACSSLTCLNLRGNAEVRDATMQSVARLAGLSKLCLAQCRKIGDGGVSTLAKHLNSLTSLDLSHCESITDFSVLAVAEVTSLADLDLSFTQVTDDALVALTKLPGLTALSLYRCSRVRAEGIRVLGMMSTLRTLSVASGPQVTDKGMVSLASLPELRDLDLSDCRLVTDMGVKQLARARSLAVLRMCFMQRACLSEGAVKALATLPMLTSLDIEGLYHITDTKMVSLSKVRSLKRLLLSNCSGFTDVGVEAISTLPELRELCLSIHGSQDVVTDKGVGMLARLPALCRLRLEGHSERVTDECARMLLTRKPGLALDFEWRRRRRVYTVRSTRPQLFLWF
mmetsp:Transcript_43870/g.83776  ORF Transcript_43870/g.83776 Transcript_43870/m.83776 type:complete len:577 (-) Transcript_43870:249-1979(-)